MNDQSSGGIAQPPETDSAVGLSPENLSPLDAVAMRLRAREEATKQPEAESEAPDEDEEQAPESEDGEDGSADEVEVEFAQLAISDEEREFIEANPQSRLAKRIGQLVRKQKEAEERAERLEEKLRATQESQSKDKSPFGETGPKPEANPFRELDTVEALQEKFAELANFIEWADDILDENEDALSDDVVYSEGDHEFTKKQVRQRLKQVRKEKETFLPARYREIESIEQAKQQATQLQELAKTQLGWMEEAESPGMKQLAAIQSDERFAALKDLKPELAGQLDYFMAHAVNSMLSIEKAKAPTTVKVPEIKPSKSPPASPQGNATPATRTKSSALKQLEKLQRDYEESGSSDALVTLRAFKHKNQL